MLLTLSNVSPALCEELPYLRSLGIGALILEGLFDKKAHPFNINATGGRFEALPQIQHLLAESNKAGEWRPSFHQTACLGRLNKLFIGPAGLRVVLDVCELDLLGPRDVAADETGATVHVKPPLWSRYLNMFSVMLDVIKHDSFPQHALRFWLQQGAAGFAICDTDAAYSEKVK